MRPIKLHSNSLENVQDGYKKRLNLLGQQTGADVTSGFRSQNEPKAIENP